MDKANNKDINIIKTRSYVSCLSYGTILPLRKFTSLLNGFWPLFVLSFILAGATVCVPGQNIGLVMFAVITVISIITTYILCNAQVRHILPLGYMTSLTPMVLFGLVRKTRLFPHIRWRYLSKFLIISTLCFIIALMVLLISASPMIILEYISSLRTIMITMGDKCDTPAYLSFLCFLARGMVQIFVVFVTLIYAFILAIMHGSIICDEHIRKENSL